MNTLSAIIIAKNEEDRIEACLDSISFSDEIIVVDGGSEDKTVDLAKKKGAKIFLAEGDDFSQMRNIGFEKASRGWTFYIDADERVTKVLRDEIKETINNAQSKSVYKIKRKNFYFGKHEWPYIENLERLFQRNALKRWYGKLHESPEIEGEVGTLNGFLLHYTHRDLSEMVKKTIDWSKTEAKLRFDGGHPRVSWWRFPRVMMTAFIDSYIKQGGWKAGTVGIIESVYQSFSIFVTYARLWEMQQGKKHSEENK